MTLTGAGLIAIVKDFAAVAGGAALSLAWTVKLEFPAAAGVPRMTPVDGSRDKPAGNEPALTDQVYGGVPPEPLSVWEYAIPTMPAGIDAVAMLKAGGFTTSVKLLFALAEPLSFTCAVKVELPAAVGVPLITPEAESRDNPAGSEPALIDQLYGGVPPEAFNVCE